MTERHASFETAPPQGEPISFDIDGETFVAVPWIPGLQYLRLLKQMSSPLARDRTQGYEDLLALALGREPSADADRFVSEHERLIAVLEDPKRQVDAELID